MGHSSEYSSRVHTIQSYLGPFCEANFEYPIPYSKGTVEFWALG